MTELPVLRVAVWGTIPTLSFKTIHIPMSCSLIRSISKRLFLAVYWSVTQWPATVPGSDTKSPCQVLKFVTHLLCTRYVGCLACVQLPLMLTSLCEMRISLRTPYWNQFPRQRSGKTHSATQKLGWDQRHCPGDGTSLWYGGHICCIYALVPFYQ